MGVSRSSVYAVPEAEHEDAVIGAELRAITDAFAAYGYRRVGAGLRRRGRVVNAKKVRRPMTENDLNPRRRRRWTRTTDSDHDGPIFPFVAEDLEPERPDQPLARSADARPSGRIIRLLADDGSPTSATSRSRRAFSTWP
jgi:putative transposase